MQWISFDKSLKNKFILDLSKIKEITTKLV